MKLTENTVYNGGVVFIAIWVLVLVLADEPVIAMAMSMVGLIMIFFKIFCKDITMDVT